MSLVTTKLLISEWLVCCALYRNRQNPSFHSHRKLSAFGTDLFSKSFPVMVMDFALILMYYYYYLFPYDLWPVIHICQLRLGVGRSLVKKVTLTTLSLYSIPLDTLDIIHPSDSWSSMSSRVFIVCIKL